MRYWWVSQNQTFKHALKGGYLWSPKRNKDNSRSRYYEFMREVEPGDVVLSFADTKIKAIGVVTSNAYSFPKPAEFGSVGGYWDKIGWRVDVDFHLLANQIRPAEHMDSLVPLLPEKYSPLQSSGRGNQVYLTHVPVPLFQKLIELIGSETDQVSKWRNERNDALAGNGLVAWEEQEVAKVNADSSISETTRQALVQARKGQGQFKKNVMKIERGCRLTGVRHVQHLRASHCKPWREASNEERLDGNNGLLLTPNVDHLFDRGFISFEDDGTLIISPVADRESLRLMGLPTEGLFNVGGFSDQQCVYLEFHRQNILLKPQPQKT